jgi:hypothetical protein
MGPETQQNSLVNGGPGALKLAVGAVCCERLSAEIRLLFWEKKYKIERKNRGRRQFFPSSPGFERVGK